MDYTTTLNRLSPRPLIRICVRIALLLPLLWLSGAMDAQAQIPLNTTIAYLRGKAVPDECFLAIGANLPFTKPPCFLSQPKVNQAYVWAMTQANETIWFGTVANPQCITQSGLFPPETLVPYRTESWVCEFGKSPYVPWLLPALAGDFRPSQIFAYNTQTKALVEMTPKVPVTPENPLGVDPLLLLTRGIRAAATIGNLVLLAGPSLLTGMNFFAFRADTKEYLGSATVEGYDNIRQMTVNNGVLYIPVGRNLVGGKVLRWTGSISPPPCKSCFTFDIVGDLDGIGAYITTHQGRLYVTTWPTGQANVVSSLYMSPPLPAGGLTAAHASQWRKVWTANDYEPDAVLAASYAGGAIQSFNGYLYWGTMHVPWFATAVHLAVYPPPQTDAGWAELVVASFRTATMFRARNLDTVPDVQLLYGLPILPAYRPAAGSQPGRWDLVENNMKPGTKVPLYGPPGFGNAYNTYTWAMSVWDNRLWVGTMDWSYPAEQGTKLIFQGKPIPVEIGAFFAFLNFGADLYFYQSTASPAVAESNNGLGNYTSFGVRNLLALSSGNSLFAGMANASNLLTGPFTPQGGWELLELQKKPGSAPLTLLAGLSCAPAALTGPGVVQCTAKISAPSTGAGVTVGVLPLAFDVKITTPTIVQVPNGQTSVTFPVQIGEVPKPVQVYLIAGVNGGTMVTTVQLNPGVPKMSAIVTAQGKTASGVMWVDVKWTNSGTATAQLITMTQVLLRTLGGTGTVTYAAGTGMSPATPANLGSLAVGASTTTRLYFNVPATVTRFSITESGKVRSLAGTDYDFSLGQSAIP